MEAPAPLEPDTCRFSCLRSLRWSDEDNQGVVNNAVYLTLLEESRHAYFTALGLLDENRFPFLLAQTNLSFVKPMRGGQQVRILVRTLQLGTTSFEQVYEIHCADSGVCHARAQARLVCYDSASGGKRPMAEEFRAALARFEGLGPG
jgi:YbgC/YbaW family acyl-CoA thioester hydrolase